MSWIQFKDYQENAVVDLKRESNRLLDADGDKVLIFKAPTGSGKTLMMAEFLKRLIDSRVDGKRFSFVWIAVNKLHDQSRNNLKKYYDQYGVGLKCSYFADLEDRKIGENEILFLNWASINKGDKGIITRANERDNNLSSVVQRTNDDGRIVMLIIDESHHTAKGEEAQKVIEGIAPKLTIEVSATPQLKSANRIVEVELKDVKDEEMIKKEIVINPGFESYIIDKKKSDKTADEIVLESALKRRSDLKKKLEAAGSSVNPLLLIQIPDAKSGIADMKDELIKTLGKYGIGTENGKLAIYLSDKDNKVNLENIEKNENEVEVMIFKQAIALGWDCPRAAILVLFRQWREENLTFSIQTLGRIMRMPEQKHYDDQELNVGYVFTSLSDIQVAEDISREYITVYEGRRREDYKDINLESWHSKRFREETRLSSDFVPVFLDAAKELGTMQKIKKDHSIVDTKLIASGRIDDIDKEVKTIEKAGTLDLPKNEVELQNAFDLFVRNNLSPFAPETRSISRVKTALYRLFDVYREEDEWPKVQAVVLAEENRQPIIDLINRAKELYLEEVGSGKRELVKNDMPWNVPKAINYNLAFTKKDYKKSIIQPYYGKTRNPQGSLLTAGTEDSAIEEEFIGFLEKPRNGVVWWFRNGSQDGSYFAIPYSEHGQDHAFYVDFIVMMKDGRIGLFDTKSGLTAQTAGSRAEGLARYISGHKSKKLFGGIVLNDRGSWRISETTKYQYDPNDLKSWDFLDLG